MARTPRLRVPFSAPPDSDRRPVLAALALMLLAFALTAQGAAASISWCRADPIVRLNGTELQVLVALPQEFQARVDGPIEVTIKTPWTVTRELVSTDRGFNGFGEVVSFDNRAGAVAAGGSFSVSVHVRVPAGGLTDIPMLVELIPANGELMAVAGVNGGLTIKTRVDGLS